MTGTGRLLVLDGYAHIYRSFYAVRDLTNPRGEPVNALFAMGRFMLKLGQEYPHEFAAAVLDKGRPAQRLELLPEYKATRPPMPDALRCQMPLIRQWMSACGWRIVEEEGREADDLIGAIARAREEHETYILSHDKDLAQLVEPGVYLVIPSRKGASERLDPAGVTEKFGVPPEAIVDYLAMIGDNVDNIPGIPGVGPKTAASLLNRFGSLSGVLANVGEIESESLRQKVRSSADLLQRNLEVVSLDLTLPAGWEGVAALRRGETDWDTLLEIARDNGFKSMIASLEKARIEARSPTLF